MIWATVPTRRSSLPLPKTGGIVRGVSEGEATDRGRRAFQAPSSGRWQRGQALPPTEERDKRSAKEKDADSPDDLWDDPIGGATGAATDFSAFGAMPESDMRGESGSVGSGDAFDFEKMAEATRKFEEELHGSKGSNDLGSEEEDGAAAHRA